MIVIWTWFSHASYPQWDTTSSSQTDRCYSSIVIIIFYSLNLRHRSHTQHTPSFSFILLSVFTGQIPRSTNISFVLYSPSPRKGSVIGAILYALFAADFGTTKLITIATFADDILTLVFCPVPKTASQHLQSSLVLVEDWCRQWRVKINETMSSHMSFTLYVHMSSSQVTWLVPSTSWQSQIHLNKRLT